MRKTLLKLNFNTVTLPEKSFALDSFKSMINDSTTSKFGVNKTICRDTFLKRVLSEVSIDLVPLPKGNFAARHFQYIASVPFKWPDIDRDGYKLAEESKLEIKLYKEMLRLLHREEWGFKGRADTCIETLLKKTAFHFAINPTTLSEKSFALDSFKSMIDDSTASEFGVNKTICKNTFF